MARYSKAEQDRALEVLRAEVKAGDEVQTILQHTSRSGMSRSISLIHNGNDITYYASRAMDERIDGNYGGIVIGGCGMDMGFALVYSLARTLFQDGFKCIGDKTRTHRSCPSNDHSNGSPFKRGTKHSDSGYALTQRWL